MTGERDLGGRLAAMLHRQARRRGLILADAVEPADILEEGDSRLVVRRPDGGTLEIEVRLFVPAEPAAGRDPWRPSGVEMKDDELRRLSYIVVDEIVEDAVSVSVSPWPAVDDQGRLVFADEPALGVQASAEALGRYLRRTDFRSGEGPRALRMGDAFAARVRRGRLAAGDDRLLPPSAWLVPPVYDIRSPARDKAKEAFYAAVAPTLSPEEAEAMKKASPPE